MATWTNIPDSSIEPGKPIRSIDGIALRDNPIAIAEGATGAPRLYLGALERISAGNQIRLRDDQARTTSVTTFFSTSVSFDFLQSGTVRVSAEHRTTSGGTAVEMRFERERAGVQTVLSTWATTSTSFTTRTLDVAVIPGDKVLVTHRSTASGVSSEIRNRRASTNGEDIWPVSISVSVEGNRAIS